MSNPHGQDSVLGLLWQEWQDADEARKQAVIDGVK